MSNRDGHDPEIDLLTFKLVEALTERGETVAFCESLTAGLGAATLATVPGASAVLRGGMVTYATDLKRDLAGVDADLLEEEGPVAAETARQMALGAREKCSASWGISFTGVAGPDQQDGHPVGEVFVGFVGPGTDNRAVALRAEAAGKAGRFAIASGAKEPIPVLSGNRAEIRNAAVFFAFEQLLASVQGRGSLGSDR